MKRAKPTRKARLRGRRSRERNLERASLMRLMVRMVTTARKKTKANTGQKRSRAKANDTKDDELSSSKKKQKKTKSTDPKKYPKKLS